MKNYTIAYVSRHIYPDSTAAALQTIQMAAALGRLTGDTHLFVHDLMHSEDWIRQQYGVDGSPFKIRRLRAKHWPKYGYQNAKARSGIYNSMVAAVLGLDPALRIGSGQRKAVFVRSRLELIYWSHLKRYLWWLRDWVLIYEAHYLGLDTTGDREKRRARTRRALEECDLVISITRSLADDISILTEGAAKPVLLSLSTGIPRLRHRPRSRLKTQSNGIVLGYIGTVDPRRGVDQILKALRFLPDTVRLRVVGQLSDDDGQATNTAAWLSELLADPSIAQRVEFHPPVPYSEVTAHIDDCDIALLPAGLGNHWSRYAAPLKLFDYMARGKPIIAAGVPCHQELLQDGMNARLYRPGDPEDLAKCIMSLVSNPRQEEAIASKAWEESAQYTYDARAKRILELVDEVWVRRSDKYRREQQTQLNRYE